MKNASKRSVYGINIKKLKKFFQKKRKLVVIGIASIVVVVVTLTTVFSNQVSASVSKTNEANAAAVLTDSENKTTAAEDSNKTTPDPASSSEAVQPTLPESEIYSTLKSGDENSEILLLQDRLMVLGYMDLDEPTKEYGPGTEYAVELFQRQHALEQNGIADPETLELLYSDKAKKYTLLMGTSGTDVDSLQRRLIDLGYMDKSTGYYGTETIEAVKAFQEQNGLDADGKTGEFTLDLIYSPDAQQSTLKPAAVARRANILEVLATAENQLGKPYVWGAEGPSSFDCSGLVYYCLREAGSSRGRYNAAGYSQVSEWEKITDMDNLEKGDLLFFSTNGKSVGHTGIYIGEGMMIDASSANGEVVERACKTSFWEDNFVVARRPW